MNGRYTALPMISMGLRLLGYTVLVVGVLTAIYYVFVGVPDHSFVEGNITVHRPGIIRWHLVPAFWQLVDSAIRALLLVGAAELIHVVLDIEENTRGTKRNEAPRSELS